MQKIGALALFLVLFQSTLSAAQDAPAETTRDRICYGWQSNSEAGVFKLLVKQQVGPALKEAKLGGRQRQRALVCFGRAVLTVHRPVNEICVIGEDPSETILTTLPQSLEVCIAESNNKPEVVFPGAPETPSE